MRSGKALGKSFRITPDGKIIKKTYFRSASARIAANNNKDKVTKVLRRGTAKV